MSKNSYNVRYGSLFEQVTIERNTIKRFIKKVKYILIFAFSFFLLFSLVQLVLPDSVMPEKVAYGKLIITILSVATTVIEFVVISLLLQYPFKRKCSFYENGIIDEAYWLGIKLKKVSFSYDELSTPKFTIINRRLNFTPVGRCLVVDFGKICYKYVLGFDECDVYSQFNSNCAHILYTLVTCNGDYSDMDILRKSESNQTRI